MLVVYIRYLKEKHSLPFNYHWGRNGQFSDGSDSFFGKTNYCRKRRKFRLQIYCLFANFYYHFIFELFGVCINIFKNTYNNIKMHKSLRFVHFYVELSAGFVRSEATE